MHPKTESQKSQTRQHANKRRVRRRINPNTTLGYAVRYAVRIVNVNEICDGHDNCKEYHEAESTDVAAKLSGWARKQKPGHLYGARFK